MVHFISTIIKQLNVSKKIFTYVIMFSMKYNVLQWGDFHDLKADKTV